MSVLLLLERFVQYVSVLTSAPCAPGLFVLPRVPLIRLARRHRHHSCLLSHARRRVCRPAVVFSSFPRCAPLAGLAVASSRSRSRALTRACPPTNRPNDATTTSLLAPSEVSSSFPTCFTRLTYASSALAHPKWACPLSVFSHVSRLSVVSFPLFLLAFLLLCVCSSSVVARPHLS